MAIGLARMFGFEFRENFNFPYIARSIQDFWHRWHISLSTWFRDYLYIPLGGNRVSTARTYLNLFIVFLCTGFWHGASWSFVIWGLIHGLFIILEKLGMRKVLQRLPLLSNLYTILIVMSAWVFFRADNLDSAMMYFRSMYGSGISKAPLSDTLLLLNNQYIICLAIGVLGAGGFFQWIYERAKTFYHSTGTGTKTVSLSMYSAVKLATLVLMLAASMMYLAASNYSPFIYYRF